MKWMYKEKLIKIFLNNFSNHNKHVIILIVVCFSGKYANITFTYMYAYVSKMKINLRKYINNFNLPREHWNCNIFPKIG